MAKRRKKTQKPARTVRNLTVAIHAPDLESLRRIVETYQLDYGCRPHAIQDATGAYYTTALVSRAERSRLRDQGLDLRDLFDQTSGDRTARATIGKGDRFKGGKIAPQGVGSQPHGEGDPGQILNPQEIDSALQG